MTKSLEEITFDSGYAHGYKAGWEQAKAEIIVAMCTACNDEYVVSAATCTVCLHHNAIAAMEYKEPTNEH